MAPAAIREDPLAQYLLGSALVILLVGGVGGVAWTIHMSEPPTLAYVGTVLLPVLGLVAATALYDRRVGGSDDRRDRSDGGSAGTDRASQNEPAGREKNRQNAAVDGSSADSE